MKTSQIIIPYDAEKLSALRQYAVKRDISIDAELTDAIDKLYEKLVPTAVRDYIDSRPTEIPARPPRPNRNPIASQ